MKDNTQLATAAHEAINAINVVKDGTTWAVTILNTKGQRPLYRHFADFKEAQRLQHALQCNRAAMRLGCKRIGWTNDSWAHGLTVLENMVALRSSGALC